MVEKSKIQNLKSKKVEKKATTKVAAKPVKKVEVTKKVEKTTANSTLQLDVLDMSGKVVGTQKLSESIFGEKENKQLVAQAIRVYLANQRQGTRSTKSRGEVRGSTRKIYRQKGTGRARHGGITAPIFVGGGVAWGPKQRDFSLNMPQKMKQKALCSALSAKVVDQEIKVVSGLEKLDGKTKNMVTTLQNLELRIKNKESKKGTTKILLVINDGVENVVRAARNIDNLSITGVNRLNIYEVMTAKQIIFMQEAIETLEKRLTK
ncbi:MAG TPA: 50S ribosomal protein L4 [Patescibacteria group bacterium]|nr:50S ribosomal protein L4 [Patescibacteria group bacterium]